MSVLDRNLNFTRINEIKSLQSFGKMYQTMFHRCHIANEALRLIHAK